MRIELEEGRPNKQKQRKQIQKNKNYSINPSLYYSSSANEIRGKLFAASIDEQTQGNGNVDVNPQNVSFNGGAKTNGSFKIDEPLKN